MWKIAWIVGLGFAGMIGLMPLHACAAEPSAPETRATGEASALEVKFAQSMQNAVLVGRFTIDDDPTPPKEDRYTIVNVKKLKGDLWLFNSRIQYAGHDLTVPLIVPVRWAGDTPVISVTNLGVPGMGAYTARVIIYEDHYAGTWSAGGTHRGAMFGRIEHAGAATQPSEK